MTFSCLFSLQSNTLKHTHLLSEYLLDVKINQIRQIDKFNREENQTFFTTSHPLQSLSKLQLHMNQYFCKLCVCFFKQACKCCIISEFNLRLREPEVSAIILPVHCLILDRSDSLLLVFKSPVLFIWILLLCSNQFFYSTDSAHKPHFCSHFLNLNLDLQHVSLFCFHLYDQNFSSTIFNMTSTEFQEWITSSADLSGKACDHKWLCRGMSSCFLPPPGMVVLKIWD